MAESANPAGGPVRTDWEKITSQVLLQFLARRQKQCLIEIALNKPLRKYFAGLLQVPTMIDSDAGQLSFAEQRMAQVGAGGGRDMTDGKRS